MLFIVVDQPHPACVREESLLRKCRFEFGRTGGPGGQHRNRVETAVTIIHEATGVKASGTERRKQFDNRRMAIWRLRMRLAVDVRCRTNPRRHRPSELWDTRRQGTKLPVNPKNHDYPALLSEALDVIVAREFDVAGAAGVLGISMSQLARLIRHDKRAFGIVNEKRYERGLPPLR
ncbi:MAG: peptide chain release factor-like protein [Phycisphaerales bacterium]